MNSFLAAVHRAARHDTAARPHEVTAHGHAAEPSDATTHAERVRAVANDPRLAGRPALRDLAVQTAERGPASLNADEIIAETISTYASSDPMPHASNARAEALRAAVTHDVDPLGAVDRVEPLAGDAGWSKVIAAQSAGDSAVASGGPFPAHESTGYGP